MKRKLVWGAVAALAAVVLGGVWFMMNFEQYETTERTGYAPEALRDRYLALGRFVGQMGRQFEKTGNPAVLDTLAPGGTIILDRARARRISAPRMAALLAWVEAGGRLIAVPEFASGEDALATHFGVRRGHRPEARSGADGADDEDEDADAAENKAGDGQAGGADAPAAAPDGKPATAHKSARWEPTMMLRLPGTERRYSVRTAYPGMDATEPQPEWRADGPDGRAQVLHYTHGRGSVTLVAGLDAKLHNRSIGEYDHAALLWALLQDSTGPVRLITQIEMPTLWAWLAGPGLSALVPLMIGLIAWIWHVAPRMGPVLPAAAPERRSLAEHLAACGRAVWRTHGHAAWVA
ncbi:MAG: DUF4350 domain-containing protein, partial [Rhodocyclaceae bacterium]|nr:DUF4350 domain-containing protein [Rhodocyclaceae bacterium]